MVVRIRQYFPYILLLFVFFVEDIDHWKWESGNMLTSISFPISWGDGGVDEYYWQQYLQ